MTNSRKFRIFKWLMLSMSILLNGFIVYYSCLDSNATASIAKPFTKFFVNLVNGISNKKVQEIPVKSIKVSISNDQYNDVPGYSLNQIPLGSAKEFTCEFSPTDATNKSLTYYAEPADALILNQTSERVSAVGMKEGKAYVCAKSGDGNYISKIEVDIVKTVAPANFSVSLEDGNEIEIGKPKTLIFDIDGGVLTHNELITFRYYDTRKLTYSSLDENIAQIDNNGVVYPKNIGSTKISVSNGTITHNLDINVVGGSVQPDYENLTIGGSTVCYANDMILSQNNSKYQYQMTINDGETVLKAEDFIWSSTNELLVKVDRHGIMRGFRKSSLDDETAIINAKSKITGQEVSMNITVKNQLPTAIYSFFKIDETTYWNKDSFILSIGDHIEVKIQYNPYTQNKNVTAVSSKEEVVSLTNAGDSVFIHALKEGESTVRIVSIVNPDLIIEIKFTVVKAGSIGTASIPDVGTYLRKSIGHAAVFMVAQIFTFLALYMFLYDKKWWLYSSTSLGEGLFISILSELIQYFVPTRSGALLDFLIDFSGVFVGFIIVFLVLCLHKRKSKDTKK